MDNRNSAGQYNETHGMSQTRLYHVWEGMKGRCYRESCNGYESYGGSGIKVCNDWLEFSGFFKDMGETYTEGLSLERKESTEDYSKQNCKWASYKEQACNKKSNQRVEILGVSLCLSEWKEHFSLTNSMVYKRLHRGELGFDLIRPKHSAILEGSDYGLSDKIKTLIEEDK